MSSWMFVYTKRYSTKKSGILLAHYRKEKKKLNRPKMVHCYSKTRTPTRKRKKYEDYSPLRKLPKHVNNFIHNQNTIYKYEYILYA